MPLSKRSGKYGEYWGNDFASSNALNIDKMKLNALYIYRALIDQGFTLNAVCGMLGNMQTESTINPGRWESDRVGGSPRAHGYGLVQWTPYNKYTNWCKDSDPSSMDKNIERIVYEVKHGIQWIKTKKYPLTFMQFSKSKETPEYLANAFLINYERPKQQNQPRRATQARFWFDYLSGSPMPTPTPTPTPEDQKKLIKKWLCARCFKINVRR